MELRKVTGKNLWEIVALRVAERQQSFVASKPSVFWKRTSPLRRAASPCPSASMRTAFPWAFSCSATERPETRTSLGPPREITAFGG